MFKGVIPMIEGGWGENYITVYPNKSVAIQNSISSLMCRNRDDLYSEYYEDCMYYIGNSSRCEKEASTFAQSVPVEIKEMNLRGLLAGGGAWDGYVVITFNSGGACPSPVEGGGGCELPYPSTNTFLSTFGMIIFLFIFLMLLRLREGSDET